VLSSTALLLVFLAPDAPTAFDPPPPGTYGAPGVRARFAESLARLQARLDREPADAAALARLYELNAALGRAARLEPAARKALENEALEGKARARVRGVLGLAIVAQANAMGSRGNFILIVNGRVVQRGRELTDDQKKLFTEAETHLRAALDHDERDAELRDALADTIDALRGDPETEDAEVAKLREEAAAIRLRDAPDGVAEGPYQQRADTLAGEAPELEQAAKEPDHVRALEKRKEALVLAFCRDTIVFDFAKTLYEPVSVLAPRALVDEYLSRTYTMRDGNVDVVQPQYHGATPAKKLELIAALGRDRSKAADAVLLALVRGSTRPGDPYADAAMDALADGEHMAAKAGLPLLLAKALFSPEHHRFPVVGQRRLVELAVRLDAGAADVLLACLDRDADLHWPRRVAWALGRLGESKHVEPLVAAAVDGGRDVAFRREAARAAALLAPESAQVMASRPELAIALAAAAYEKTKSDDAKGRLLNGFSNDHEIDEAAAYCAELKIVEAVPAMEAFLAEYGEKKDHPARLVVERARAALSRAP